MDGWSNFIENWNNFFTTCGTVSDFISKCFNETGFFVGALQGITHDLIPPILLALVILRFLGFKGSSKYFSIALVLAVLVAML